MSRDLSKSSVDLDALISEAPGPNQPLKRAPLDLSRLIAEVRGGDFHLAPMIAEDAAIEVLVESVMAGAANTLPLPGSRNVDVSTQLQPLRVAMEEVFSCSTAFGDCIPEHPSAGHCILASMVVQDLFGGRIVGGRVNDIPHYWNRFGKTDVDITGDQFGFPEVRVKRGPLHKGSLFGRKPQQALDEAYNRRVNRLHKKFVKSLVSVLRRQGHDSWARQLSGA